MALKNLRSAVPVNSSVFEDNIMEFTMKKEPFRFVRPRSKNGRFRARQQRIAYQSQRSLASECSSEIDSNSQCPDMPSHRSYSQRRSIADKSMSSRRHKKEREEEQKLL